MKNTFLKNQRGASLLMVLGFVGLGIAGLSYTITDLLPRLQKEKTKVEASVNYKVFMASLNDYVIHGLRERWCFNLKDGNVTDLLLSDKCGNGNQMEEIVTYPGNLERVLWTANNIGTTPPSVEAAKVDNRILAINYLRYHNSPRLASRLLSYQDVAPKDQKLTFKLTSSILHDMSDEHPLYLMTRAVKECIDSVDIEIFQVQDASNIQSGDERKIGISLRANITPFKMKCLSTRNVSSVSYYTFYPRRLHTFSLMKYGELDGSLNNEYHGPVYVAGDFVLPPVDSDPANTSVFYNTLTLGVFNGGSEMGGRYRAGKIITSDKADYTFTDRGHPYLSKQDSYKGFRGFRGGVRLDATEDKGFYNLFSHSNTTAADMDKLKECIEEAKYQTTPSLNDNTILAYTGYTNNGSNASIKLSFTERNRFKPGTLPSAIKQTEGYRGRKYSRNKNKNTEDSNDGPTMELLMKVPPAPNGTVSYGEVYIHPKDQSFDWSRENHYAATLGSGSSIELFLNYDAFDLSTDRIDGFVENIKKSDRGSYSQVISSSHVLYQLDERRIFNQKAEDLRKVCDKMPSEECHFFGYTDIECGRSVQGKPFCSYSSEVDAFKKAAQNLEQKLQTIRTYLDSDKPEDDPKVVITMSDFFNNKKLILNQKQLEFSFNESWKFFFPYLKKRMSGIRFEFHAFNYSKKTMDINLDLVDDSGNSLEFGPQNYNFAPDRVLASSSWRRAYDNKTFYPDPKPIEELDCPDGMGLADWDLDMSPSSAFAWNYANTPSGVVVDTADHENLNEVIFSSQMIEGHRGSTSKSVVDECIVPADRKYVYGFYVCKRLVIKERSQPLYMIGTFIVKDLVQPKTPTPVYWHSIWDTKASDLVMNDLNASNPVCGSDKLSGKTFDHLMKDNQLKARMVACSSLDLVNNGPNNFSWTTVDPDIGIAKPGDTMTSQKVNRIQKWVIKEESRVEVIR